MKLSRLKSRLRTAAPGPAAAYLRLKEWARSTRRGGQYLEGIFSEIYRGNLWGEPESVSGPGSTLAATAAVRRELPGLFSTLSVRTLLDAPCGDCNWIFAAPLDLDLYIGADLVPELIARNAAQLGGPGREFRVLDLTCDPLPRADAILCRDCLIHFSYRFIRRAFDNFRASGARYLLTTTYAGVAANHDILSGQWRPIDLELPPFGLPRPLHLIREKEYVEDGRRFCRSLGIWEVAAL
ncbi:MAG TPA: class I SAM-dependent methyltransferase [Thermoanaerobaculia bacterium]|nr:class I SAM-dependent methyltransferase [Thermoanaerobaculia bacterium]